MFKKLILFCSFFILLSACGLEKYPSGHLPAQARLTAIKTGDSMEKVVRILGTPAFESPRTTTSSPFLIYAKNLKTSRAFLDPKEVEREVYVYVFNKEQTLSEIKHLTLNDREYIRYNSKETETNGTKLSITEQLINNFGRYNSGSQDSSVRR